MPAETRTGTHHEARDITALLGQRVQVEELGVVIREGKVEAITEAGDLLWIYASGCDRRAI